MTDRMVWLTLVEAQEAVAGDVSDVYKAVGAGRLEQMIDEADGKPRFRFPQSATDRRGEAGDGPSTTNDPVPLGSDQRVAPRGAVMSGFLAPYREDGTGPVREWTGNHVMECANSARGGHPSDTGCRLGCYCPCHEGWRSRAERGERSAEARARFRGDYTAELERARAKGYTEEHDHEHGPQHLLDWATEYIYRGEPIKAAAMIAAARALLACGIPEHHHGTPVSADLIRAEALAEAADIARRNLREHRYPPEYGRVEEIAIALQERAAEYRKEADRG